MIYDKKFIKNHIDNIPYESIIASKSLSQVLNHLMYENEEATRMIMNRIMRNLERAKCEEIQSLGILIKRALKVHDSFTNLRVEILVGCFPALISEQ